MTSSIRDVGVEDLEAGLQDGSIVLVDVREPHEFAAGHIPGSLSMPLSAFDAEGLPSTGRVVFSCAAGVRSKTAIDFCQAAGLSWSEHYPGGFKEWFTSGRAVARGDS